MGLTPDVVSNRTIVGLIADTKQGCWSLVAGETLGLVLVIWAITTVMHRAV